MNCPEGRMAKVLMDHEAGRFYCWRWDRWWGWSKFFYCCQAGCHCMLVPENLLWKAGRLGGLLVPAEVSQ
jgi:hypothetical protein